MLTSHVTGPGVGVERLALFVQVVLEGRRFAERLVHDIVVCVVTFLCVRVSPFIVVRTVVRVVMRFT